AETSRAPTPTPTLAPTISSIARRNRWPRVASMETMAATGANNGARCPNRCTATNQERPAPKAVWTTGTATLRQQLTRPVRCPPRRDQLADLIDMPLGRVGHFFGSGPMRGIFPVDAKPRSGLRLLTSERERVVSAAATNKERLLTKREGETSMISAAFPYKKQQRQVLGRQMSYVEAGEGDPIVLLHGNPTSSYLWRNVLPHLQPRGRCIAPDLIGMGDSDKLPNSGPDSYRFVEHRRYLDTLLELLDVRKRVTFVIHDWGSALGFDWANRHRNAVKGIAIMEAIVAPQGRDHWDKMGMRPALEALRSDAGEAMVLQNNYFIEEILPKAILRKLSDEEMAQYRRPFAEPGEGRRPTLTWPRQIPIAGEPADVHAIATEYANWLGTSNVPKLFLKAEPGAILANDTLVNLVRGWPALTEKTVAGIHFVQEDSPDEIGRAIARWMKL